ncbi:MAG: hypothetical protein ACE5GB_06645 [Acidimicrobiales bacterium]
MNEIGSVYLDPRRPPTLPTPSRFQRGRAALAFVLVMAGLTGVTLAGVGGGLHAAISDPALATEAIDAAFDDALARAELEQELADALTTGLLGDAFVATATTYGIDARNEIAELAEDLLDDPDFRAGVDELVIDIHRRILLEPDPSPVDVSALTAAARSAAAGRSPALAALLPPDSQLVTIDAAAVPDLSSGLAAAERLTPVALLAGLALPAAAFLHPRRYRVVTWMGRWALVIGLVLAVAAVGLPFAAGRLTGWVTIEAAVRALSLRLLAPAGLAGIVGAGLVSVAGIAERREQRRLTDEGAAHALGAREPLVPFPVPRPAVDLTHRGLIDTGRPLTNI